MPDVPLDIHTDFEQQVIYQILRDAGQIGHLLVFKRAYRLMYGTDRLSFWWFHQRFPGFPLLLGSSLEVRQTPWVDYLTGFTRSAACRAYWDWRLDECLVDQRRRGGLVFPDDELQRELVLQSSVMWTDDTPITVLGGPKGSFKGHFWTYVGDKRHPYSVYDFTTSHSRDGPSRFLEGYSGYLHADAYTGYDAIFLGTGSKVLEVACWAHARRKFFDAVGSYTRAAHQVLEWIRQLYDIEDRSHDWSVDARRELRVSAETEFPAAERSPER